MCLDTSKIAHKHWDGTEGKGWKVIRLSKTRKKWKGICYGGFRCLNKWVKCYKTYIISSFDDGGEYSAGFHLFKTRKEARQFLYYMSPSNKTTSVIDKLIVVKCRYRKVVATGQQNNLRCIVAKEVFIEYDK